METDDYKSYYPLAMQEGIRKHHPNGYMPMHGIPVFFVTFDDVIHLGETLWLHGGGTIKAHDTVFFDFVNGKRTVYFSENVKLWKERKDGGLTELNIL